jgi:allantoate deiminase
MLRRLEQLFALGSPPHANRPGLSHDEQAAYDLAADWMTRAGLQVSTDSFGNLFGRRPGQQPELAEVWTGSHLDTVPAGGRFDGALGVVAAIEALSVLGEVAPLARTAAAVSFRDEEGWRFGGGTFGSRGVCGRLSPDELESRDHSAVTMRKALHELGLTASLPNEPGPLPGGFVELHIEQGPVLAASGYAVGCVGAIVGMVGGELIIEGRAGHAGTTPMGHRADALVAAAHVIGALAQSAEEVPDAVATVGAVQAEPGASNVIPSRVVLTLDLRAPDEGALDALAAALERAVGDAAGRTGCRCELRGIWRQSPVGTSPEIRAAIVSSAGACQQPIQPISSGALHDAAVLAGAGVPTGMIFARSNADGVSHTPDEDTDPEAILAATRVLARTMLILAGGT